jgi:two-component system, LytTR family, response regulator LytT
MNIAIIEDEAPALVRIKKLINEVVPDAHISFTADSIESAIKYFGQNQNIDIALFDIELADGQSFEIFKHVDVKCPIIFTTAYDEFALKAFKINSIDYLLKPIDKNELASAITKFKTIQQYQPNYAHQLQSLLESFKQPATAYKKRFLIKNGTKLVSIGVDDIAYFHAYDKLVFIHLYTSQRFVVDYTLDELIKVLDKQFFFQINRQYIINIKSVQSIHTYFNGKLKVEINPTFDNEDVLISRERASDFKEWLGY